jgi:hypothetical protein
MFTRTANLIGGPFYFLLALAFGLLGYALGLGGGYLMALAAQHFGFDNDVVLAALGGLCAGIWPVFLRREKRLLLLALAVPAGCIASALVMSFLDPPTVTGMVTLDTVFFGTMVGGATAMTVLMPVPVTQPSTD